MHQERNHPGRVSGTDLDNPDVVALAQADGEPAVIEIGIAPEAFTPRVSVSQIREARIGTE